MITIFTPTYNRVELLKRLYSSLYNQSSYNFEWLIVDDGSNDNTNEFINILTYSAPFTIKYIYQENSGKHIAHNRAVKEANGDIFLCIDSDDYLSDNKVIEEILIVWEKYKLNNKCAGIISDKITVDGNILGDYLPNNIIYCSPFELEHKLNIHGERNIIYRLDLLKKYQYPEIEKEKFFPDSYISDAISKEYIMVLRDKCDVICEYQQAGLSSGFSKLMKNYPIGFCIANMQIIDMLYNYKDKIFASSRYWAFKYLSHNKSINYNGKHKVLIRISRLWGMLLFIYYKIRL